MSKNVTGIVDYYQKFRLDRNLKTEEILKQLRSMQGQRMNQASMNPFDREQQAEIEEDLNAFSEAIKTFESNRDKYDRELDKAYREGKISEEEQKAARDFLDKLDEMLKIKNYNGVVKNCKEALSENVKDVRLYHYLAMANYGLNNMQQAFISITQALTEFPNDFQSLCFGARYSTEVAAYECAQGYLNRLFEISPNNPIAIAEQCYLYEHMGNEALAFKLIDEYLQKNPNDSDFRRACAYDLITLSHTCYVEDPSTGSMLIASQEAYEKCLAICSKAAEIYRDDTTVFVLENAKYFGKTEYNKANLRDTAVLLVGSLFYLMPGVMFLSSGPNPATGMMITIGVLLFYSGIRLAQVSFRPYWQINKFYLTGRRERSERFYIKIGSIFAWYLKWSFKISLLLVAFIFAMMWESSRSSRR